MRSVKRLGFSLAAVFLLLCGGSGWSSAEVQPKWTFAVVCDTRGNNDNVNLSKSGVNEVMVDSMANGHS